MRSLLKIRSLRKNTVLNNPGLTTRAYDLSFDYAQKIPTYDLRLTTYD